MSYTVVRLAFTLSILAPSAAEAQAARVGRLPVLELPPAGVGTCRSDPVTPALQREGIARMISFQSSDSSGHRLISLGLNVKGASVMLMAMMGTEQGRRGETESVNAFFDRNGITVRGRRSAFTTGMPARRSDDRQLDLLPADTLALHRLDIALRQRCLA
jgi:hypothetical protein